MNRARDSQRSKVYAAEWHFCFSHSRKLTEMTDLQARVTQITASKWWRSRIKGWSRVKVKDGRGRRSACAWSWDFSIAIPRSSRTEGVLLHELAHLLTDHRHGRRIAAHGREFCMEYLALVRRFMGKHAHDELRAAFKAGGVKYRPKVQLSPEERQRRREQILAVAARTPAPACG